MPGNDPRNGDGPASAEKVQSSMQTEALPVCPRHTIGNLAARLRGHHEGRQDLDVIAI